MEENEIDKNINEIEKAVLNAFEIALDAQLKAIRRLKSPGPEEYVTSRHGIRRTPPGR